MNYWKDSKGREKVLTKRNGLDKCREKGKRNEERERCALGEKGDEGGIEGDRNR
jgi:hypothetical protein